MLGGEQALACPSLLVGVILLQSLKKDTKGTAPAQLLGRTRRTNWILGLKVFVECFSPTGIFGLFVPSTYIMYSHHAC